MNIEPYEDSKLDAIVRLSLRAWEPVFDSIRKEMDADVVSAFSFYDAARPLTSPSRPPSTGGQVLQEPAKLEVAKSEFCLPNYDEL